jgi:RNA polymerase sigma factor (sigma-70 family)
MVLGVGLERLGHEQDAQDVFQATFLALSQEAKAIRDRRSVAGWLKSAAYHAAAKVPRRAAPLISPDAGPEAVTYADPEKELLNRELKAVLDEEIRRLPKNHRAAFIACRVDGMTHEQAAAGLGCPVGTVSTRVRWATDRLMTRLLRRGYGLSAAIVAMLGTTASASIPAPLVRACADAAGRVAAGQPCGLSERVVALSEGLLASSHRGKCKALALVALVLAGSLGGAVAWSPHETAEANPALVSPPASQPPAMVEPKPRETAEDRILREQVLPRVLHNFDKLGGGIGKAYVIEAKKEWDRRAYMIGWRQEEKTAPKRRSLYWPLITEDANFRLQYFPRDGDVWIALTPDGLGQHHPDINFDKPIYTTFLGREFVFKIPELTDVREAFRLISVTGSKPRTSN